MKVVINYQLDPMNPRPYTVMADIGTTRFRADSAISFVEARMKVLDKIRKIYLPVPEPEEIEVEL